MKKHLNLIIFLAVLIVAYGASTLSRNAQYTNYWQADPAVYYVDGMPVVSTLDAYKWTRIAAEYRDGTYGQAGTDTLMYYPDGHAEESPVPMLSVMLAKLSGLFGGNLYETGLAIIPFFAGLFMIPFAVYFYRLKMPVAGIAGAVIGTFCATYYMRTTPGRIDTDALNLFFPFLTALFIMLAFEKGINKRSYIYIALAGFSQLLFYWWYHHASFILIFFVAMVVLMLWGRLRPNKGEAAYSIKAMLLLALVYIICSNPLWFAKSVEQSARLMTFYFFKTDALTGGFPNIYQTITEAAKMQPTNIISAIFINPAFFVLAIAGLGLLCFKNLRKMIPILPVFALGLMAFVGSLRFVMYLAPFLGLGIGYLIHFMAEKLPLKEIWQKNIIAYGVVAAMVLLMAFAFSPRGFVFYARPSVSIDTPTLAGFKELKEVLPADAAIYTWWDYGLAIEDVAGLATFHDGMNQNTPKTWLIARSFVKDQKTAAKYVRFAANEGMAGLERALNSGIDAAGLIPYINTYEEPLKKDNVYILFTRDMISKYGAISTIGNWDIAGGKISPSSGGIDILNCSAAQGQVLQCGGVTVDLSRSFINNNIPLKGLTFVDIETGTVSSEKRSNYLSDLYAVVLQYRGTSPTVFIVPETVYNSMFFQLYILGRYDSELYEEVINNYPLNRVFKLRLAYTGALNE